MGDDNRSTVTADDPEAGTLALALYDFEGQREDMLPFSAGEILTILEMNPNGWWKGANLRGKVGIFPYSYVEVKIDSQESFPLAKAIYSLGKSEADPELLAFEEGEILTILRTVNSDWSYGRRENGDEGRFPLAYVELTGEFNEELFNKETDKWERLEKERKKEMLRLATEKEELQRKMLEEQQKEKEKVMQQKMQEALLEAEQMKKEMEEMKRRQKQAEYELQVAKAEAARLRRLQNQKEARKSVEVRGNLELQRQLMEEKVKMVEDEFDRNAPGPPPMLRQGSFSEAISLEVEEDPFGEPRKTRNQAGPMMQAVYKVTEVNTAPEEPRVDPSKISKIVRGKTLTPLSDRVTNHFRSRKNINMPEVITETPVTTSEKRKTEEKKVVEVPVIKPETPKIESPRIESPKVESPKIESPKVDSPKIVAPTLTAVASVTVDIIPAKNAAPKSEEPESVPVVATNVESSKKKPLKKFANLGKGPECRTCGKPVGIANRVKACKAVYHDECFRCSTCDKVIRNGEYIDRHDNPYCHQCHRKGFGPKGFGHGAADNLVAAEKTDAKKEAKAEVSTQSWV